MKKFLFAALTVLVLTGMQAQPKINLLVVSGGHKFDSTQFFAMFDAMKNVTYTHLRQPQVQNILNPKDSKPYDVILFYDMWSEIDMQHRKDFTDMIRSGRSVLFLHHSIASYDAWPEWMEIVGAKYVMKSFTSVDGLSYNRSSYKHDVPMRCEVMKNNPVFAPGPPFEITDEVQNCVYSTTPSIPLMLTTFEDRAMIGAWLRTYGKGTIITFKPGHDKSAFTNPDYQNLLYQAIAYLAKKNRR